MANFFKNLFSSKSEKKDDENKVEELAKNPEIQNVTLKHLKELAIPEANASPEPLTEEELEEHEDTGGEEGTESEPSDSLKVKPYKDEEELTDEELEKELEDDQSEESEDLDDGGEPEDAPLPSPVKKLAKKIIVKNSEFKKLDKERENTENTGDTESPGESGNDVKSPSKKEQKMLEEPWEEDSDDDWQALQASKYKKNGKQKDFYGSTALDKVQTGMDVVSGVSSLGSTGIGLFDKSGLGGKVGMSDTVSDSIDIGAQSVSLGSDALSLGSSGISVYKNIRDMKKNDKFTTDNTRQKQKLTLASNLLASGKSVFSMGSTMSDMGGSISSLAGNEKGQDTGKQVAGGLGSVKNVLGATKDTLDLVRGYSTGLENINSSKQIKKAMNDGKSSEEFKKMANVALEAKTLNTTSAGFDFFKSGTSMVGNVTGLTKNMSKMFGVDSSSDVGQFAKWTGLVGAGIGAVGSVAGLFNTVILKNIMKSKRKKNNIDQFIKTNDLKNKTNNVIAGINRGKGKAVDNDATRELARKVLGYSTGEEMFSAILLKYAATIRHNAESGEEKDKYRLLIEQLGFKLQLDNDLPSEEAIAGKLSAVNG